MKDIYLCICFSGAVLALISTLINYVWLLSKELWVVTANPDLEFSKPYQYSMNISLIIILIGLVMGLESWGYISKEEEILIFLLPILTDMAIDSKILKKFSKKT